MNAMHLNAVFRHLIGSDIHKDCVHCV